MLQPLWFSCFHFGKFAEKYQIHGPVVDFLPGCPEKCDCGVTEALMACAVRALANTQTLIGSAVGVYTRLGTLIARIWYAAHSTWYVLHVIYKPRIQKAFKA